MTEYLVELTADGVREICVVKRKMRTVLVKTLNVSGDGWPVDEDGEECAVSGKKPLYTWERQRRGEKWLAANPKLWKPDTRQTHGGERK